MENRLSDALLDGLLPPSIRNAADYSEQHIILPEGDSHAGRWHNRPYQVDILRAMSKGSRMKACGAPVREVVLLKSCQVGYSCMILNSIAYHIIYKPGNIGVYQPSKDSAKAYGSNQLARFIEAQPSLDGVVSSVVSSDNKSSGTRKTFDGGSLRVLAANNKADVASHTFGLVYIDEIDLIKGDLNGEGDPVELIKNRTQEFHDALVCYGSTPRGAFDESRVWNLYQESDRRRYYVRCPKCDRPQYLAWKQFRIGQSDYNKSGFICIDSKCNHLMTELDKPRMIEQGFWKPTHKEGIPGRAGFHIFAALSDSPTVSWPNLARMRDDMGYDKDKIISFQNTKLGLPSRPSDYSSITANDVLERLEDGYHTIHGTEGLPNDICLLTVGVDCQTGKDSRLEYSLWGWAQKKAYFLRHAAISGDLNDNGVWEILADTVCINYVTEDRQKVLRPAVVFIDSGDGNVSHRVYERCLTHRKIQWFPIKGNSTTGKQAVVRGNTPGSGQPLFHIQTTTLKDKARSMLTDFTSGNPNGELRLPIDCEPFVIHGWLSESRKTSPGGKVVWVHNSEFRNEPLDVWVYAMAAMIHYTGAYDQDLIWSSLERRAKGKSKQKKRKNVSRSVDFGGYF